MTGIAIRTENLSRSFGAVQAVSDLNLEVPAGTVFGFLGPNGAGKTTTIRLLLGLLEPSAGRAAVLGLDTQKQAGDIRRRCGALLEYNGLYERLSAEDNLEFYGRVWQMPVAERKARIKELLTRLDLWERRSEPAGAWSRGMKQKLAVARTLLHRPQVIFLDEPTAGLDPLAAAALRDDLSRLAEREGVTVFLTTHNLAEAEKLCQQVGVIRGGRLLEVGPLDVLRAQAGGPRLEISGAGFTAAQVAALEARPEITQVQAEPTRLVITSSQPIQAAPIINLLVSQGAQIEEVHKGQASLEEAFITLLQEENGAQA